jgi:hypothetical protein
LTEGDGVIDVSPKKRRPSLQPGTALQAFCLGVLGLIGAAFALANGYAVEAMVLAVVSLVLASVAVRGMRS